MAATNRYFICYSGLAVGPGIRLGFKTQTRHDTTRHDTPQLNVPNTGLNPQAPKMSTRDHAKPATDPQTGTTAGSRRMTLATLLRRRHRDVKQNLQHMYWMPTPEDDTLNRERVLYDAACGRAGSMWSWGQLQPTPSRIIGCDLSADNLRTGQQRLDKHQHHQDGLRRITSIQLHEHDLRAPGQWPGTCAPASVDLITCHFAIHFLCGAPEHLVAFVREAERLLVPGGSLVGVFIDGDELLRIRDRQRGWTSRNTQLQLATTGEMCIEFGKGCPDTIPGDDRDLAALFGSNITVTLQGENPSIFARNNTAHACSNEFLVHPRALGLGCHTDANTPPDATAVRGYCLPT